MPIVAGREVGAQGFGLMSLTPPTGNVPRAQAFAAMNAALESGANLWNGGQFYGTPKYNSLHLLRDYFLEFPDAAEKVVLSIKGGLTAAKIPDGSEAFVRRSVEGCLEILPPSIKRIDVFQCARVDPHVPIERTMQTLRDLFKEGKIGAVGLSEVRAETIRRAFAIVPIAAVEVEFSLFEISILHNSVADTCADLGIPVVAYSPLGRGILTGKFAVANDIPADSILRRMDKYQGENLEHNLRLVQELLKLSQEHRPYTMAHVALSWIRHLSASNGLPVMIPISGSSKAEHVRDNLVTMPLTAEHLARIWTVLQENKTTGSRSYAGQFKYMEG